jgi:hypothetical protein
MDEALRGAIRGFLQLGFFVGGGGLLMLFFQPPNSAEFVLSACSALMGIFLILGSVALLRWASRHSVQDERQADESTLA